MTGKVKERRTSKGLADRRIDLNSMARIIRSEVETKDETPPHTHTKSGQGTLLNTTVSLPVAQLFGAKQILLSMKKSCVKCMNLAFVKNTDKDIYKVITNTSMS